MTRPFDLSLYLVAGRASTGARGVLETVKQAVAGGTTIVQLRDPHADTRDLVADTRALVALLRPRGIAVIVNDRVDVAVAADADGVHLGQDDMTPRDARRIVGPDRIIGFSIGSPAEFESSRDELGAVDYLGIGPIRSTSTKSDAGAAIGLAGFAAVRALARLPVVGIGGLGIGHVGPVIEAGADGVAVVSAICGADDPEDAARTLAAEIARARR